MQMPDVVVTNDSCPTSANRVHFEEPEKFKLLPKTCPAVFAYMPSIHDEKHTKNDVERPLPHVHSMPFRKADKPVILRGDSAERDTSIQGAILASHLPRSPFLVVGSIQSGHHFVSPFLPC